MCGIFGITDHKEAGSIAYLGLYALQHRGEESAGIVSCSKNKIYQHRGMGLVGDVFDNKVLSTLKGTSAVGHVRYSTTGSSSSRNVQPFIVTHKGGHIVVAHNGNLTNSLKLKNTLEDNGAIFQSSMDSEVIIHLLTSEKRGSVKETVLKMLSKLEGAFSLVLMLNGTLIAARDPLGFRPLCIGKIDGAYVFASETCAFDLIGAEYIRDVEPGEVVFVEGEKLVSMFVIPVKTGIQRSKHAFCIFEYIYFARPDSDIFGGNVYEIRKRMGRNLADESSVEADMIMPMPDSGNYAAVGFAEKSGLPLEFGMIRNHYVGRTFIQPFQQIRDFNVKVKLNPVKSLLKGKRIVIVEDSIVRGTTSRSRIKALREAGAKEIHMRISCPPIVSPCFYGIDFPNKKELIASAHDVEWIKNFIGLDSLHYLSLKGMLDAMLIPKEEFCAACFTKKYPTIIPKKFSKLMFEPAAERVI